MNKKVLIFDLDGTLVDSIKDVAESCNYALNYYGFPSHKVDYYKECVGGNLEVFISKTLPENKRKEDNVTLVKTLYRDYYKEHNADNSKPFQGVLDCLQKLINEGYLLAVNTNKGQVLSEDVLAKMFPEISFAAVKGYRTNYPCKPDPYGVNEILKELGVRKENSVYIGDTETDILTAKNTGIPIIYCSWGQGKKDDILKYEIENIASEAKDISFILNRMENFE